MAIIHNKTGNIHVNITLGRIRETTVPVEKQEVILHIESVSITLAIQHAKRKRCIYLWPVQLYSAVPNYPINGKTFGGKRLLSTKCV